MPLGGSAADYIHDFVHSSDKRFKGKSKAERIQMALGAYYGKRFAEVKDQLGKLREVKVNEYVSKWSEESRAASLEVRQARAAEMDKQAAKHDAKAQKHAAKGHGAKAAVHNMAAESYRGAAKAYRNGATDVANQRAAVARYIVEDHKARTAKQAPKAASEDPRINAQLLKVDEGLGLVFGWAIVCKKDGQDYYDLNRDKDGTTVPEHIPEASMLECAADFMQNSRVAKDMHGDEEQGSIVFAFPLTSEIAKSMGIASPTTGLMIAMKPKNAEVLEKFKNGTYRGFSIGGQRVECEDIEEVVDGIVDKANRHQDHTGKFTTEALANRGSHSSAHVAWTQGTNAHGRGKTAEDNPHPDNTKEHAYWEAGRATAAQELINND